MSNIYIEKFGLDEGVLNEISKNIKSGLNTLSIHNNSSTLVFLVDLALFTLMRRKIEKKEGEEKQELIELCESRNKSYYFEDIKNSIILKMLD